jgi:hypothetical protein
VNINPGTLAVTAGSQIGGVSVSMNGNVSPSGTLSILSLPTPPGQVLFNGIVLNPPPAAPAAAAGGVLPISVPDLRRTNEPDHFTPTLTDVVGQDSFGEIAYAKAALESDIDCITAREVSECPPNWGAQGLDWGIDIGLSDTIATSMRTH